MPQREREGKHGDDVGCVVDLLFHVCHVVIDRGPDQLHPTATDGSLWQLARGTDEPH
jgi:hypothetical protein